MFQPPFARLEDLPSALRSQGFAVLDAASVRQATALDSAALTALAQDWNQLAPDAHLKDGGRYRQRRHASFMMEGDAWHDVAPRPHWQPLDYNALHGGMLRWFEPVTPATLANPAWRALMFWCARVADDLHGARRWFVEAHPFRIDTADGIGRPTPEGAHRDGVDLVAVFLVQRQGIKGGETRVFELDGPRGQRFTLVQPWSVLLLNDRRVVHETTPIQPLDGAVAGYRDTLVVTLRGGGFLDPS